MRKITLKSLALICCLFTFFPSFAQEDWRLRKSAEGIEVYTKKIDGSALEAFRGITHVSASISSLTAVLYDVGTFPEWMFMTPTSELISRENKSIQIHYTITDSPWPVADRDAVIRYQYKYDESNGSLLVLIDALPDLMPEKEGLVRVKISQGIWRFTPENHGLVKVEYELHADPNGNIPAWLVNSAAVDTPFKTLKALKAQVKKDRYQSRSFSFMKEK